MWKLLDRGLEIDPAPVSGTGRGAFHFRVAADGPDVLLQVGRHPAALLRHLAEELPVLGVVTILGRLTIALHAVEGRGGERVEN